MAVGKASIKRAVNAGKAAAQKEPAQEQVLETKAPGTKEPESVPETKEEKTEAANKPASAKKTAAVKKTAASKKSAEAKKTTTARKPKGTGKAAAGKPAEAKEQGQENRIVHITEELPVYLL